MKLQQVTGPVMAKGLEDTVFYVYNRLVVAQRGGRGAGALRDQRGDLPSPQPRARASTGPGRCSPPPPTTPSGARTCARAWWCSPRCPREWRRAAGALARSSNARPQDRARRQARAVRQRRVPPLPDAARRLARWATLDRRRARRRSATASASTCSRPSARPRSTPAGPTPTPDYEEAVGPLRRPASSTRAAPGVPRRASRQLKARLERARPGELAASQVALKLATPGVPDIYQGCELWDLSLVDPDNRRPVDFRAPRASCSPSCCASTPRRR